MGWDVGAGYISGITAKFQSTHPVWGGTVADDGSGKSDRISIHPPRVGWDPGQDGCGRVINYFNPPTPCGVGPAGPDDLSNTWLFQSTHPVWGGTAAPDCISAIEVISIHPPRVGWDVAQSNRAVDVDISIHPPRVGWDRVLEAFGLTKEISIHPPRVGWDRYS